MVPRLDFNALGNVVEPQILLIPDGRPHFPWRAMAASQARPPLQFDFAARPGIPPDQILRGRERHRLAVKAIQLFPYLRRSAQFARAWASARIALSRFMSSRRSACRAESASDGCAWSRSPARRRTRPPVARLAPSPSELARPVTPAKRVPRELSRLSAMDLAIRERSDLRVAHMARL